MKEAGVKPIAIFDEPGPREWKAREHLRRQAQRSLNLARSLLEDARRERLVKVENVLQEARALLQTEQLPARTEVDIENDLLNLDEVVLTQDSTAVDEAPGRKTLHEALLLLRECRASSRPGEKHTTRSVDQILMDRSMEEEGEAGAVDVAKVEPPRDAMIDGGDAASVNDHPDSGLAASLKHVEEQLARMPLIDAEAETSVETVAASDPMLLEQQEDDIEDIATVVVEPSLEFTETIRQMALTANENYIVSDIIKTITSDSPSQLALLESQQELRDLQDRAKEVSKTYERSHAKPTAQDMEEARELLEIMGVPIVQAPSPYEAEGLCAAMVLSGMADYAGTEDSDVLVYGALLLKNVGTSTLPLQSIDGEELRTTLDMTNEQYK
jgi:flap endonuclease-1